MRPSCRLATAEAACPNSFQSCGERACTFASTCETGPVAWRDEKSRKRMTAGETGAARLWGIHYAWVVVAVAFLTFLVAAGVRSAPTVLIVPLEDEFGWSRADISFAVGLQLLLLRTDRAVRRRPCRAVRIAGDVARRDRAHRLVLRQHCPGFGPVAACAGLGPRLGHRHRRRRLGARRHHCQPLVRGAARFRLGSPDRRAPPPASSFSCRSSPMSRRISAGAPPS